MRYESTDISLQLLEGLKHAGEAGFSSGLYIMTPQERTTVLELFQNWECGVLDLHMLKIRRNSWVGWCANVTIFCVQ